MKPFTQGLSELLHASLNQVLSQKDMSLSIYGLPELFPPMHYQLFIAEQYEYEENVISLDLRIFENSSIGFNL